MISFLFLTGLSNTTSSQTRESSLFFYLYRSIKHYFLLDKGDFIVQFMDMTEDEMRQDMENITPTRLETLLELALRTSTANTDQFKDDLR